jgi:hypothetical protein
MKMAVLEFRGEIPTKFPLKGVSTHSNIWFELEKQENGDEMTFLEFAQNLRSIVPPFGAERNDHPTRFRKRTAHPGHVLALSEIMLVPVRTPACRHPGLYAVYSLLMRVHLPVTGLCELQQIMLWF